MVVVLHALGQCLIRTAVTTITPRADMCFALASYLSRERGKRVPRRWLESLLWPGMRAADASHSLSELIHKLGRKGIPIQRDNAACVWIPREAILSDVDSLSAEAPAVLAERDLSILPGYVPRASPAFKDWVDDWRSQLQLRVLDDVVSAISRSTASREWRVTLALAEQALKIDPANDTALLARAHAAEQLVQAGVAGEAPARRAAASFPPLLYEVSHGTRFSKRPAPETHVRPQLVGREREMEILCDLGARAVHGDVCAAYISAPPGAGKSRLVRELVAWIRAHGGVTCTVECLRHGAVRPLSAFVRAVPLLQALPGAAGCAPETVSCLARITSSESKQPEASTASMPREDSYPLSESVRASVIDLVDAVTHEQPLLLLVEDIHWLDHASWSLLRTIIGGAHRGIFLVCTSRAQWQHSTLGEVDPFVVLELPALTREPARKHLVNYLVRVQRHADEQYLDWCVDASGGNPYFIEELVNFWIATGDQYSAPPSLVALIDARLACLSPGALRVLQAASILSRSSSLELLQQVLEFPTHALLSAIEELGQAELLLVPPSDGQTETAPVVCRHDLITRSALRGLSAHGRALLHHAAARAIEPVAVSSKSSELLWDCADHWRAAGQFERATRATIACARHLHDMGLVHEAIKCCDSALARCSSDTCRGALLREMAESQYGAREWHAFCETVAQIRILERGSNTVCEHDDLELCELTAQRRLHRNWSAALERALQCVQTMRAPAAHRIQAGIIALKFATNVGALATMDRVYASVESLGNDPDVRDTDALTLTMVYHAIRGDAGRSAAAARELLAISQLTLSARRQLTIMLNCITALRRCGVPGESEELGTTLFHTAISLRCFDLAADACNQVIEMHVDSGRMDLAIEWAERYRSLGRPADELTAHGGLCNSMARIHVSRQQWEQANHSLESRTSGPVWKDEVNMLRAAGLATKLRIEIGRRASRSEIASLVQQLATLNDVFQTVGGQDYECYTQYLGYCYIGEDETAVDYLQRYANVERRDTRPVAPEIASELRRLGLGLGGQT